MILPGQNEPLECCEEREVHTDVLQEVRDALPDDELLYDLAELFKVFGDSTRIKILYALFEAEMCVCDIANLLGLTQSAISHQLRTLKANKLVRARREGKTVYYSLADQHVRSIVGQGMEHVME
ncbi:MAG: winged helix-turn-helix transcriptional regulator [Oscillospiraceae bacterium]|nr:winged helix-turn-helix transcriptional regulator [Oscillospiraceae bacterium]